ncbi:MAG: tRNA pseudouridine(55) synthase TruB [Nitrospirae bacterium]|nr:MAG: tRNA pseudouridine(55) synthase TruB [Nitrospirota bacterium]
MWQDGVLNVNKPAGWTSHDVVAKLRKALGIPKIGHAGTLDPMATGVLPILVGKATRLSEFLLDWDKEYEAVLRLGQTTDTQDATGTVIRDEVVHPLSVQSIVNVVAQFQGRISQLPPMYSAVKKNGVPLYRAARAGQTVERTPRWVMIHQLDVQSIQGTDVALRIRCSKGTYIRTLCADIGERLGVGGHLYQLTRVRVGPLEVKHALSLEQACLWNTQEGDQWMQAFLPMAQVLREFPAVVVPVERMRHVLNGRSLSLNALPHGAEVEENQVIQVVNEAGQLVGLGRGIRKNGQAREDGLELKMIKVFMSPSGKTVSGTVLPADKEN